MDFLVTCKQKWCKDSFKYYYINQNSYLDYHSEETDFNSSCIKVLLRRFARKEKSLMNFMNKISLYYFH